MTYEQLLNAHFLKHPGHSKIVHFIFQPLVVLPTALIAVFVYSLVKTGDSELSFLIAIFAAMYPIVKFFLVGAQMTGHGVGLIKKGPLPLLGLTTVATICELLILGVIIFLVVVAYQAPESLGFEKVKVFSVSLLFSFIMSMLYWRFHAYYETWYGSEYDARIEFQKKGYAAEIVEERIEELKRKGILF